MAVTVQGASINTGSSSMGAMVAQHWSKKGLLLAYPTLNFIDFAREGGRNAWLKIPARKGNVINFYKEPVDDPSYTTYNESADDPSPATWVLTASSATASLYLKSRVLTDLGEGIALVSPTQRVAKGLAFWGMRTFNGLIGGQMSAASVSATDYYCDDATSAADITATDVLTRAELDILAMKLEANNVRTYMDGLWKYRAHPVTLQAIRADTGTNNFWELIKYVNEVKGIREDFLVGRTSNFEIKSSTEVVSTSVISGTGWGFYNLWSGMEAIGATDLAGANLPGKDVKGTPDRMVKKPKWEPNKANFHINIVQPGGQADPHNRRIKVGAKLWVGLKVLNTGWCGYHMAGSAYSYLGV